MFPYRDTGSVPINDIGLEWGQVAQICFSWIRGLPVAGAITLCSVGTCCVMAAVCWLELQINHREDFINTEKEGPMGHRRKAHNHNPCAALTI